MNDHVTARIISDAGFVTFDATWKSTTESELLSGCYGAPHGWACNDGRWRLLVAQAASFSP